MRLLACQKWHGDLFLNKDRLRQEHGELDFDRLWLAVHVGAGLQSQ